MESAERKKKFIALLQQLLIKCQGVKGRLAENLEIKQSSLSGWLKGEVDPASLDILIFSRVANFALQSTDELAQELGIVDLDNEDNKSLNKFQNLLEDLLSSQTQEKLGQKLGVSRGTINAWISSERTVTPARIPVKTIAAIAREKGWTIEGLLAYLGLKKLETIEEDLLAKIQSSILQLSLTNKIKLQSWFSLQLGEDLKSIDRQIIRKSTNKTLSDRTVLIILEKEDNAIRVADLSLAQRASKYTGNLILHLQLSLENISIATIQDLPESLEDSDILIFDISSPDSPSIALIQEISFDGDIVIFTSENLPENLRAGLEDKVSDVLVKPIDWSSLKDKEYF